MQAEPVEIIDTDHEVMSYEALNAELDKIEFRIAQKYQLRGSRRRSIILDKIRRNELLEDELIEQWHALFSSILNLAQDRARESTGPPPNAEPNHSQRPQLSQADYKARLHFVLATGTDLRQTG